MPAERLRGGPMGLLRYVLLGLFALSLALQVGAGAWGTFLWARLGRAFTGEGYIDVDYEMAARIRRAGGYPLGGVNEGAAAHRAGLRQGDLIVEVSGRRVDEHPGAWYGINFRGEPGETLRVAYRRGADPEAAARQAEAIARLDAVQGAYAWARVWNARGDSARATAELRRTAALDTSGPQAMAFQAVLRIQEMSGHREAAEVCRAILARSPGHVAALYQLGKADLLAREDLAEAAECFRRYLAAEPGPGEPTRAGAHWRLGMVYELQGRREEAMAEFRESLDLEPNNSAVVMMLRDLERATRGRGE